MGIAVGSGGLALLSLLGLCGARQLIGDLRKDDDGKETRAQRLLEVYFWAAALLGILTASLGAAHLMNDSHISTKVRELAFSFPKQFEELSANLQVDAAVGPVVDAVRGWQLATASLAFLTCLVLLVCLVAAGIIVTPFEILQGLLYNLTFLHLVGSVCLLYLGTLGWHALAFKYDRFGREGVAMDMGASSFVGMLEATLAIVLTLGSALVPTALLGLTASYLERARLLLIYECACYPQSLLFLVAGILCAAIGGFWEGVGLFVYAHCPTLVQLGAKDWFQSLAPGVQCEKYYALLVRSQSSGSTGSLASESISCASEEDVAFAWEYAEQRSYAADAPECGVANSYGCLNTAGCCPALVQAFRRYSELLSVVAILWSLVKACTQEARDLSA